MPRFRIMLLALVAACGGDDNNGTDGGADATADGSIDAALDAVTSDASDAGDPTLLAKATLPQHLAVEGDTAYWTENTIVRRSNGGAAPETVSASFDNPQNIAVRAGTLYVIDWGITGSGSSNTNPRVLALSASAPPDAASPVVLDTRAYAHTFNGPFVDGQSVWICDQGTPSQLYDDAMIQRVPIDGGSAVTVVGPVLYYPSTPVVTNGVVYAAHGYNSRSVLAAPSFGDAGFADSILMTGPHDPSLDDQGHVVVFTGADAGQALRVEADAATSVMATIATPFGSAAIDGHMVYFYDPVAKTIARFDLSAPSTPTTVVSGVGLKSSIGDLRVGTAHVFWIEGVNEAYGSIHVAPK